MPGARDTLSGMLRRLTSVALIVAAGLCAPALAGCHQQPAQSAAGPSREVTLAFASAVSGLEVLDELHAQRMRAIPDPTPEQVAWLTAYSARLHRLRDALVLARSWLEGKATERDGRAAFRDAAEALQLLVDDLKSQGIEIPKAVEAGLVAAKYVI